jgi:hypothetical protein
MLDNDISFHSTTTDEPIPVVVNTFQHKRQEICNSISIIKSIEKEFSRDSDQEISNTSPKFIDSGIDRRNLDLINDLYFEDNKESNQMSNNKKSNTTINSNAVKGLDSSSNQPKIRLISDTLLEPKTTTVVSISLIKGKNNQLYCTNGNPGLLLKHSIGIVHSCFDSSVTNIPLTNFSHKPVLLKAKTTISKLTEIIDEIDKHYSHPLTNSTNNSNLMANALIAALSILTAIPTEKYTEMANRTGNQYPLNLVPETEFKINKKLKFSDRKRLLDLIREYDDIFAHHDYDLGCSNLGEHKIELIDNKIVARAPYKTSIQEREKLWHHIENLLKYGIIRPSLSPYASPVLLVNKYDSDGNVTGTRMVIDFRKVNKISKTISYPLPLIGDAFSCLSGHKYFSTLDSIQGYHQMLMDKDSIPLTAFTTPFGNFEYLRAPFGLSGMVQAFMKMMNEMVGSLQYHELLLYLDDIITWSKDIDSHLIKLRKIFDLFRSANIKLKPSKCNFLMTEINFLGHVINSKGIHPQKSKVEVINKIPVPKKRKELLRFLGATNFYSKFIESYATLAAPLYALIRNTDTMHNWTEECQRNFDEIKLRLMEEPVLYHYDSSKTVYLRCDCSDTAIGLILLQEDNNKALHPIAYHSKALKPYQKSMSITAKEYLSIVYATRLYRNYLLDKKFIVITDHQALKRAKDFKPENKQLTRFDLELVEFDFDIRYTPGKNLADADMLSRLELQESKCEDNYKESTNIEIPAGQLANATISKTIDQLPQDIKIAQHKDRYCKSIIETLSLKRNTKINQFLKASKKFILIQDILYRKVGKGEKLKYNLVIPYNLQEWILNHYHTNLNSHLGAHKTIQRIRNFYWFKNMDILIKSFIKTCSICGQVKHRTTKVFDIPKSLSHEQIPYYHIYCDFVGPIQTSTKGNEYIIVCVDAATRHLTAMPTKSQTTLAVIKFFKEEIIPKYGLFRIITTDNGSCFTSKMFKEFLTKLNIKHNNTTPYTPTANAISERYVKTIIDCVKSYCSLTTKDWEKHLRNCVFSINSSEHKVMKFSPIYLLMGYKPRTFVENQLDIENYLKSDSPTDQLIYSWILARREAHENLLKHQSKQNEEQEVKCRLPPFTLGSLVWLEDTSPAPQGLRSKFRRSYIGPYCIVKLTSDKTYWLINATKVSSARDFKRADSKKLKHYNGTDKKVMARQQKLIKLINENFYERENEIKNLSRH